MKKNTKKTTVKNRGATKRPAKARNPRFDITVTGEPEKMATVGDLVRQKIIEDKTKAIEELTRKAEEQSEMIAKLSQGCSPVHPKSAHPECARIPKEARWPKDWWQAVKDRFAPMWVLARWPVEYEVVSYWVEVCSDQMVDTGPNGNYRVLSTGSVELARDSAS